MAITVHKVHTLPASYYNPHSQYIKIYREAFSHPSMIPHSYSQDISSRPFLRYWIGWGIRYIQNIKYWRARRIARHNGAKIGDGAIFSVALARKMNANVVVGAHTSIQTDCLDTRNPLHIGEYVIIGHGTEIITTSHNIDSPEWERKDYGLVIEDYVWLPTKVLVLPSCRRIGRGAVASSGSIVVCNVEPMQVVGGNPAKLLKMRECVHSSLVVESLLGGDFSIYRAARKAKNV